MRRHVRPYQPKKQWKKNHSKKITTTFEIEILSREGETETCVTYVMKISESPCCKCQHDEHGRVFKVIGIGDIWSLCDWEPIASTKSHKELQKKVVGRSFCMDCLP